MRKQLVFIATFAAFALGACAGAVQVQYMVGVDDYAQVYLDGNLIMSYDAYPSGSAYSAVLDLSAGWHDLNIVYKNRWGSDGLHFNDASGIAPKEILRSLDASGNTISGLRADYFNLTGDNQTGSFVKTVYGEGPIYHWYSATGPNNVIYQGVDGALWGGVYTGWGRFEEHLSGQVYVADSSPSVPGPAAALPMLLGLFVGLRRGRRR